MTSYAATAVGGGASARRGAVGRCTESIVFLLRYVRWRTCHRPEVLEQRACRRQEAENSTAATSWWRVSLT